MLHKDWRTSGLRRFFRKITLSAERKNFTGNALQSDGTKRGSPPLRLENQPARTGMSRISEKRETIEKRNA
ncbi:hypothetical protein LPH68_19335 [Bacteroides sp. 1_1_30]|nr:hypothetical protein [Bacteroides sp. 1_1_30]